MKFRILATVTLVSTFFPITAAFGENIEHTQQLLATKQCAQCDLSGAGLVLANLSGADLRGANLSGANLSRANLSGVNLSGANLSGANLAGADLRTAYVGGANLVNVNLSSSQILGVRGMPTSIGGAEDFYRLGVTEAKAGNYRNAIDYYNQALSLKSDLAAVYFARSMSFADLGDFASASQDAEIAAKLFAAQGNARGEALSKELGKAIVARQKPTEPSSGGGGWMNALGALGSVLLKVLF